VREFFILFSHSAILPPHISQIGATLHSSIYVTELMVLQKYDARRDGKNLVVNMLHRWF
jgi:hypothetical protein